jgi:tetratricopeptide (TPR) repeat protein
VFAKLKELQATKDYAKAIEYVASALETTKDPGIRWRLENSRQVYLEWSGRYDDALANSRRLQKDPELSAEKRESLLDREAYNLFNLKRIDEAIAHMIGE